MAHMSKTCPQCGATTDEKWLCPDCNREYQREWRRKNKDACNARMRQRYADHKEAGTLPADKYRRKVREQAITAYGGKCECCGEDRYEFLVIDHIDGGGRQHRQSINSYIYKWLRDEGYPAGFRVLCHNCNCAFAYYGRCPHQGEADA